MGMCASRYIFQAKLDKLLGDIEGVKIDIDDILVLRRYFFKMYIYQWMTIFGRLRAAGLKDNAPKWSFSLKEIPYLGYVIKNEGI